MACLFTATAEADLEAIADYIARDNPSRAVSFIEEIRRRCRMLAHAPRSAPLVPRFGEGVRKVPFGKYLIFYEIVDGSIIILHVLHGARNLREIF